MFALSLPDGGIAREALASPCHCFTEEEIDQMRTSLTQALFVAGR